MSKILYIFDVDDTLIATTAKVRVVNAEGDVVASFSSQVYNNAELLTPIPEGCRFDFTEFDSLAKLLCEPLLPAFDKLRTTPIFDTYIFTARHNKKAIKEWLRLKGVRMFASHIRCLDRRKYSDTADFKGKQLSELLGTGKYSAVEIYEDDKGYIKSMVQAAKPHQVDVQVFSTF